MSLTTAERIFFVKYQIIVPAFALTGSLHHQKRGVATSDNKDYANEESREPVYLSYPISRIAGLVEDGVSVTFVTPKDTLAIYTAITDHLKAWKTAAMQDMHKLNIPRDDLITLNDLASRIYPIARQWMAVGIKVSKIDNALLNYVNARSGYLDSDSVRISNLATEHDEQNMVDITKHAMNRQRRHASKHKGRFDK